MGVSSEMFKDRYDNHVVFVVFERAGSKEAKDQQRLLDDILPVLAQHSKRPISVIKAPLGYQDATGKVVPNYEAAMIGMIKSDLSRFTTTDGINLMPDKVGYPDAYAEMYIGNGQDAKRVWYFTPRLTPSTATYEQTKKVVGNAAGRAIYASNREFEAAAPHTSAVDKATPDSPAFAVK